MKYVLIDKIESLAPGKRIVTSKNLSMAEEYLADHFPTFPVLPGVLMLEAMTQSAAWLVRLQQDYHNSIIVLQSARNVRYSYFLKPGNTLRCEVDVMSIDGETAKFKGAGYVEDRLAVSAKLELRCTHLAGTKFRGEKIDEQLRTQLRQTFLLLGGREALARSGEQADNPNR